MGEGRGRGDQRGRGGEEAGGVSAELGQSLGLPAQEEARRGPAGGGLGGAGGPGVAAASRPRTALVVAHTARHRGVAVGGGVGQTLRVVGVAGHAAVTRVAVAAGEAVARVLADQARQQGLAHRAGGQRRRGTDGRTSTRGAGAGA